MTKKPFHFLVSPRELWRRITAVLIAILLWFIVSVTVFPTISDHIHNIPVDIPIENTVAETNGLQVTSETKFTVSAQIRGKRFEIGNLTFDDLYASVSLENVTSPGVYKLNVSVIPRDESLKYELISVTPSTVEVRLDRIETAELDVEIDTSDITVAQGYLLGTPKSDPSTIIVSGPIEEVEKVVRCVATPVFEGELSAAGSFAANITLLDIDNLPVVNDELVVSKSSVNVTMPVYIRQSLPLDVTIQNIPQNFNIARLRYTISPSEIEIGAPTDSDSSLKSWNIGFIDIREIEIGKDFQFKIELPAGYKNITDIATATVSFPADNMASQTFNITKIYISNPPSGYDVKVLTAVINNVPINGPTDIMKTVTVSDIVASVDLLGTDISVGSYTVPVKIFVPTKSGVWASGIYEVSIDVTESQD